MPTFATLKRKPKTKKHHIAMKKTFILMATALMLSATAFAKELKVLVVKTQPEMHCNSCETKIKNNIRFTSGVKRINTDLETKQVTITYDADKSDSKTILAAFKKIGYNATVVSDQKAPDTSNKKPVDATTSATAKTQIK